MASSNDVIIEEIEALEAIMMEDLNVLQCKSGQPSAVEVNVKPATAQNIEEQHVRVTLIINLPSGYPDEPPAINLRNPRGIDDNVLHVIRNECIKKCNEFLGLPVLYELIELVRENLTANNAPSCPCAICLFHFTDNDHFTKTMCFHYFHSNCLGRYIINCQQTAVAEEKENQQPVWMTREKRQKLCPVCREPLHEEISGTELLEKPPPEEGELLRDFDPASSEIKSLREKMIALYLHQKANGGIIDLEEEKNKFLISAAVTNVEELLENESLVEENPEDSSLMSQNKDSAPKQVKSTKYSSQNSTQNIPKPNGGIKGTSHSHSGRRDYSASNNWWKGNRTRNNKRGSGSYNTSKQNNYVSYPPAESSHSKAYEPKSSQREFDDRFQNKRVPRQGYSNHVKSNPSRNNDVRGYEVSSNASRNNDVREYEAKKCQQSADVTLDEGVKHGRNHYYRNTYHRRSANGSSSKGAPPPGFSELEINAGSHATS